MRKFQDMLYKMALNEHKAYSPEEANFASDLYEASKEMSDDELAIFVADNDDKLRSVLGISQDFPDDFVKEYNDLYVKGKEAFVSNDEKLRGAGKQRPIADYMKAFKIFPDESGWSNRDYSKFTDPNSETYWGKQSDDAKHEAAISLGYKNTKDMERDLTQLATDLQHTNSVEGFNPDGTLNIGGWVVSAAKGLVLPRVKEAQLAHREPTAEDFFGDMLELGLNFVPGVGFVSKSGKVVARMPKIANAAKFAGESMAVPFGSTVYDLAAYSDDPTNYRSGVDPVTGDIDWKYTIGKIAALSGGTASLKGIAQTYGSLGKNFAETTSGGAAGDAAKRGWKQTIDEIGTKTDALISNRQAMLDRKAELAMNKDYLKNDFKPSLESRRDNYVISQSSLDDIINAQDYKIRTDYARQLEAQRFGNRNPDIKPVPTSEKPIVQLEDGRYVYADKSLLDNTDRWTPDGSGVQYAKPAYKPQEYKAIMPDMYDELTSGKTPELARLVQNTGLLSTRAKESIRDAASHALANTAAREGFNGISSALGSYTDLVQKRDIALWNRGVRQWREIVNNNPTISPAMKKRYLNAWINIKEYGIDSLPAAIYESDPEVYDNAVKMMGIEGWPHKVPDQPTTSNSTKVF